MVNEWAQATLAGAQAVVQRAVPVNSGFVTPEGQPIYVPAEDVERLR